MTQKESIIFAGYRSWAADVYDKAREKYTQFDWHLAENPEELLSLYDIEHCKVVLLAGWSWILSKEQVREKIVLGFHPSDLSNYAGGSPIQNQILDGIIMSKMTLFRLNEKIDHGKILYKVDLSLGGGIDNIFTNMTNSCLSILSTLMKDYPDLNYYSQKDDGKKCRRLKPEDSALTLEGVFGITAIELYNFIRCREDPYPNAYIEDSTGVLYFKKVNFKDKEKIK